MRIYSNKRINFIFDSLFSRNVIKKTIRSELAKCLLRISHLISNNSNIFWPNLKTVIKNEKYFIISFSFERNIRYININLIQISYAFVSKRISASHAFRSAKLWK